VRVPAEDRDPAEKRVQERLQVARVERRQHVDAPEPDDHARHGGEHLDERPDRPADRGRREPAEEEPDCDRHGRGEQERGERRDGSGFHGGQDSSAAGPGGRRSPLRHTTLTTRVPPGWKSLARLLTMIEMSTPAITVNPPHTEISPEVVFDIDGLSVSYGKAP